MQGCVVGSDPFEHSRLLVILNGSARDVLQNRVRSTAIPMIREFSDKRHRAGSLCNLIYKKRSVGRVACRRGGKVRRETGGGQFIPGSLNHLSNLSCGPIGGARIGFKHNFPGVWYKTVCALHVLVCSQDKFGILRRIILVFERGRSEIDVIYVNP